MFKKMIIIIVILIIIILVFIPNGKNINNIQNIINKLELSEEIVKYDVPSKMNYSYFQLENVNILNELIENNPESKIVFIPNSNWSTKNDNYFIDILKDRYYIMDKDYYYYLPKISNFKFFINNELSKIKILLIN